MWRSLVARARRRLRSRWEAEDAAQDVMVVLLGRFRTRWPKRWHGFALVVLDRQICARFRRAYRGPSTWNVASGDLDAMPRASPREPATWPLEVLAALERGGLRARLTAQQKQVYGLLRHGLTDEEIANDLGLRLKDIHSQVQAIVKKGRALVLRQPELEELYERERERERNGS